MAVSCTYTSQLSSQMIRLTLVTDSSPCCKHLIKVHISQCGKHLTEVHISQSHFFLNQHILVSTKIKTRLFLADFPSFCDIISLAVCTYCLMCFSVYLSKNVSWLNVLIIIYLSILLNFMGRKNNSCHNVVLWAHIFSWGKLNNIYIISYHGYQDYILKTN